MDRDQFRAIVIGELYSLPSDKVLTSADLAARLAGNVSAFVEWFRGLDRWCRDMSYTEPELKTRGPNKGKIVNARRWCHPSRLPAQAAREPNTVEELRAKIAELEARVAALET